MPLDNVQLILKGLSCSVKNGSMSPFRQFNPYAMTGTHNYTPDEAERDALVKLGWHDEGVAWYGISSPFC